jgi:glycosidase
MIALALFLPTLPETVVYEANLRAEGPEGGFALVTKRLPSIKALGVNVIWLMPVQPVGKLRSAGGLGSPYATANYDVVNPEFGTPAEFKALVAKAHALKIAVLIDWAANHTAWDHPWVKAHSDWYMHDAEGKIAIPEGTNWQDVADLDYSKPALREAMITSMRGWITRYGLDGFRCDTADFLPYDFWKEAIPKIRAASPRPLMMLGEGFRADHYAAGFDLTYGWPFFDKMCAIYKGAKASELASAVETEGKEIPVGARRLRFVANHDKAAWEGTTLDFFRTPEGVRGATVVTALYGGTPLIYTGEEVGWDKRVPIFDRSSIDWGGHPETRRWMSSLFALRRAHPSLQCGTLTDFSTGDAIVFMRRKGMDQALVVANVRDRAVTVNLPASAQGKWRDGFSGRTAEVSRQVSLPAYASQVFVR